MLTGNSSFFCWGLEGWRCKLWSLIQEYTPVSKTRWAPPYGKIGQKIVPGVKKLNFQPHWDIVPSRNQMEKLYSKTIPNGFFDLKTIDFHPTGISIEIFIPTEGKTGALRQGCRNVKCFIFMFKTPPFKPERPTNWRVYVCKTKETFMWWRKIVLKFWR